MSKILKSFGMAALLVALLAGTGMAAPDNTTLSGTVDLTSTITAPAAFGFGSFIVGDNNKTTDAGATLANLTVTCNGAVTLQAQGTDGGFMKIADGDPMTHAMWLTADKNKSSQEAPVQLTGANQAIKAGIPKGVNTDVAMDFGQKVLATDTAGNFAITVTFSAVA